MNKDCVVLFEGKTCIVPLASVQHVEKHQYGIKVITDKTKWDHEKDCWGNNIWIDLSEAKEFLMAWRQYCNSIGG